MATEEPTNGRIVKAVRIPPMELKNGVVTFVTNSSCGTIVLKEEWVDDQGRKHTRFLATFHQQTGETEDQTLERANSLLIDSEHRALRERLAMYEAALRKIANPIAWMRQDAEAQGMKLNGAMAITLAEDHNYLKQIAESALSAYEEIGK